MAEDLTLDPLFNKPLAGKKPRLIAANGEFLTPFPDTTPIPASATTVVPGPGPAPITLQPEAAWTCAVDCLKELIHDIEAGRLTAPIMIYVAMQCPHPDSEKAHLKSYPSYCWTPQGPHGSAMAMTGLLSHHLVASA